MIAAFSKLFLLGASSLGKPVSNDKSRESYGYCMHCHGNAVQVHGQGRSISYKSLFHLNIHHKECVWPYSLEL